MANFCTYFNKSFLPFGLSLIQSLKRHCPVHNIYVLCLDQETYHFLSESKSANLILIRLADLEYCYLELSNAKLNRSQTEYFWTLTPCLIYYILVTTKSCDRVTYLDADQLFFSSPASIFNEIKNCDIAILPHRFPSKLAHLENHGLFNVSWLTFNNTRNSVDCLEWWRESCLEWCYAKGENGRYGDQKYLDLFPVKYKNVHIISNTSCGLAPWNLSSYDFKIPVILFHYQSLRKINNYFFIICIPDYSKESLNSLNSYLLEVTKSLNKYSVKCNQNISDKSLIISNNSLGFITLFNKVLFIKNQLILKLIYSTTGFN